MDLQEFVAQTLIQIVGGVTEARSLRGKHIAPELLAPAQQTGRVHQLAGDNTAAFLVEFDVAVTAVEKSEAGGGGRIQVMSLLSAKGEKTQSTESSSVSRVRFEVPISYDIG